MLFNNTMSTGYRRVNGFGEGAHVGRDLAKASLRTRLLALCPIWVPCTWTNCLWCGSLSHRLAWAVAKLTVQKIVTLRLGTASGGKFAECSVSLVILFQLLANHISANSQHKSKWSERDQSCPHWTWPLVLYQEDLQGKCEKRSASKLIQCMLQQTDP